jgi:beta-galactosidase
MTDEAAVDSQQSTLLKAIVRIGDSLPGPSLPAMSNVAERHSRIRLTSRWIEVDGRPAIPVSGEMHFSRIPRDRWEEELRLLVSSGITLVSTYVFWIHHEPHRGQVSFDGDLDLAAFLAAADRVGIDVILRIGPWVHAEARNGGLPDWVLDTTPQVRQDDPAYLAIVAGWFSKIAGQAARFCGPDGRIVGIQLENELYDQPQHLITLKKLAKSVGLAAPLWTATAWGGAALPPHEVFPLYSGYADGFWADQGAGWDDSFRDHFTFTHVWDDPGVGGDQRDDTTEIIVKALDPEFPPATCELGGGMATAYHRRPIARGEDIAAVANIKIGNGSLWQGFYMYVGGTNPIDGVQESHATGYPNDMPRFDYDFQAAIGATGQPGPSLPLLREHNIFLASFGEPLAGMVSTLPDGAPVAVRDRQSLRWAVRSNGDSGFIFLNTHQPHEPLASVRGVQLSIEMGDEVLLIPDRPIDIPSGLIARWPLRLDIAGVRVEWATASVIGVTDGIVPTLVLKAHAGIQARILLDAYPDAPSDGGAWFPPAPQNLDVDSVTVVGDSLRILVVDESRAERLWVVDGDLIESDSPLWSKDGVMLARSAGSPVAAQWTGDNFVSLDWRALSTPSLATIHPQPLRVARSAPARYGSYQGRSSAPDDTQMDEVAAVWRLTLPQTPEHLLGDRVELVVDWEGDVAQLRSDGVVIADRFWDGRPWRIDITSMAPGSELTLHIAPISEETVVDLDDAVRRRILGRGQLCAVLNLQQVVSVRWAVQPHPSTF